MPATLNSDALLNEYKGSLFEFLVSKELACLYDFESNFLHSLSSSQMGMLSQQEQFLRNNYPNLLISLPLLAKKTAKSLVQRLQISNLSSIKMMGMNANANNEVDILITDSKKLIIPISLKLSRSGSFTNTKSAGVKSFLQKYFNFDQDEFNQKYERDFREFAYCMYQDVGEDPIDDFSLWEELSLPTLPGKLEGLQKDYLFNFYKKVNKRIVETLEEIYLNKPKDFIDYLAPLSGFSSKDVIQVTTFYKLDGEDYQLEEIKILSYKDLFPEGETSTRFKMAEHSFEIYLKKLRLQVRLKPMNKFTHKSYKVNCALKLK